MRIHPNIFLVSSLLLTPAFLWLLPFSIQCARYMGTDITRDMTRTAGLASLTVIIVALIAIWTWLVAGNRVAWLIIAIIVWVWACPIMILPFVTHRVPLSLSNLSDWVASAWHGEHLARTSFINVITFSLMFIGLILPVRALFRTRQPVRTAGPV
jgi:hypothetical protein